MAHGRPAPEIQAGITSKKKRRKPDPVQTIVAAARTTREDIEATERVRPRPRTDPNLRLRRQQQQMVERFHRRQTPIAGGGLVRDVQTGLEFVGLGGLAHPIRRAQHPGGEMMFPFGSFGGAKTRAAREAQGLLTPRSVILRLRKKPDPVKTIADAVKPEAAQKVTEGLAAGRAQTLRREQEALRHEERVQRVAKSSEAMQSERGLAGLEAAKDELRGALPSIEFRGLRELTEAEIDDLVELAKYHPDLQHFERIKVMNATKNAWLHGQLPTKSEHKLLVKTFGPEFTQEAFNPSLLSKSKRALYEAVNLPRAFQSTLDVSYTARQLLVALIRHPVITGRAVKTSYKDYLFSEKKYQGSRGKLESAPDYEEMRKAGLAITDLEHSLARREEGFQSQLAEKMTGGTRGPVRASGRAFTGASVDTRVGMYRHLHDLAEKQGYELGEKGRRQLADYINAATGRGNLGAFERSAVGMNTVFFAPRLIKARLDFLMPHKYVGLHPFVRKQKLRAAAQFFGLMGSVLWIADQVPGVDVGIDPTNADFGKIRVGNTRIDIAGGFSQYVRLFGTLAIASVGQGDDRQAADAFWRFLRGKEAPVTSLIHDFATHTNYAGYPLEDWKKEIYDSFIPFVLQDVRDIYNQTSSVGAAAAAYGAASLGIGVQSYGEKPKPKKTLPPREQLEARLQKYPVKEPWGQRFRAALDIRERWSERKQELRKETGADLSPKQEANTLLDVAREVDPRFREQEAKLRGLVRRSRHWYVEKTLLPWWKKALGFNALETYNERINERERAKELRELEKLSQVEVGR